MIVIMRSSSNYYVDIGTLNTRQQVCNAASHVPSVALHEAKT